MLITAFPAPARSLIMAVCLTVAGPGPLNSLQLLTGTQRSKAEMCLLTRGEVAIVQALFLIFLTDLGVVHFCALLFLGGDGEMNFSPVCFNVAAQNSVCVYSVEVGRLCLWVCVCF